jgi:uncharacterized membrane protein
MASDLEFVSKQIGFYMIVIGTPLGAILNMFAIYIFTRPALNRTNMGFLFRWQKTIDTICLISYALLIRSPIIFDFDVFTLSDTACKLLSFYKSFILTMSSAIMAFIAFDRFLFIHYQKKFKFMKRKRNLMMIIGVLALTAALFSIINLFFYVGEKEDDNEVKMNHDNYDFNSTATNSSTVTTTTVTAGSKLVCRGSITFGFISEFLLISLRAHLPLSFVFIVNCILIKDLVKSKNRVQSEFKLNKREIQFTFTVIFASFVFFALYFPISVMILLKFVFYVTGFEYSREIFDFFHSVSIEIAMSYLILEFFVLIAVNKLFRHEIVVVFKWLRVKWCSREESELPPITSLPGSLANSVLRL